MLDSSRNVKPDSRGSDHSTVVAEALARVCRRTGRGATVCELGDELGDAKVNVRAELGILLGQGLVFCEGLSDGTEMPCWHLSVPEVAGRGGKRPDHP